MKNNPKIFVIVVTYKGQRWYDKCFGSLRESTILLQVIAVDNSPGDEDSEYIKSHFPEVHLIKTNENLGFGKANNLGMRYALDNGCDYVFLLNQDAWIESNSIAQLVEIAEKHPEYAIISPIHLNAKKDHLNVMIDDGNRNYGFLSDLYTNNIKDVYTITYVNAAAWLLPRKTLETIGGFCPLIYHYGEDDDYMNRLRYHKMLIGLVPQARIVHDSSSQVAEQEKLRKRAAALEIETLLDINNPTPLSARRRYFLRKMLFEFLKGNFSQYKYFKGRYQVITNNFKELSNCQRQHKVLRANWLK